MPSVDLQYPKQPYGTVNRYSPRGTYALRTIHHIVNTCPILHVSFNVPGSPFPTTLPYIGQMGSFDRPSADEGDVLDLYLHGYVSSRIMNVSRKSTTTSSAATEGTDHGDEDEPEGLPVSVAASHLDGLVLALTPNSHSYNYRSAVLFGHATLVDDPAEKLYAMELITDGVVPGRWRNSRVPPNTAEMSSTSVLRVRIATGSAKIRAGPPSDDRHDLEDQDVVGRVWTGVVPVHTSFGEPIPGPYNVVDSVPTYVGETIEAWNESGAAAAKDAAKPPKEPSKGTTTKDD